MKYLYALQAYLYTLYMRGYSIDQAACCFREVSRRTVDDSALVNALAEDLMQRLAKQVRG